MAANLHQGGPRRHRLQPVAGQGRRTRRQGRTARRHASPTRAAVPTSCSRCWPTTTPSSTWRSVTTTRRHRRLAGTGSRARLVEHHQRRPGRRVWHRRTPTPVSCSSRRRCSAGPRRPLPASLFVVAAGARRYGRTRRPAVRRDRPAHLRGVRKPAGRQPGQAERQLPDRLGHRIPRRGNGAGGQGGRRQAAVPGHPDLDAVRRAGLPDLRRADRAARSSSRPDSPHRWASRTFDWCWQPAKHCKSRCPSRACCATAS